jgi:hypothetical protein
LVVFRAYPISPLADQISDNQEAEAVEKVMAQCQSEVDTYGNKTDIPINFAFCEGVLGAVTAPFTTE